MKGYIFLAVVFLLHHKVFCISSKLDDVVAKPSFTEEHLNWSAFNGNSNTQIKNVDHRREQKPIASTIYKQPTNPQQINNEKNSALLWDGENCPSKTTGLFPVQSDCRKFLNCFKGRGYVQSCAPGTLFNPNNLECDFPAKVQCFDGNPSKIDSSFINRNPSQHFDLNAQASNEGQAFVSHTNQYQQQSSNQFHPRPLVGSQFIVEGQNSNTDSYSQQISSSVPVDYGLQAGGSKPLHGSNFVTNVYAQTNAKLQPQQFFPAEKNKLESQITPNGQIFNPRLSTKSEPLNVNVNYPERNEQQFPVGQNFNQNQPQTHAQGYVNPGQKNIPLLNEQSNFGGSQFLLEPDNYGMPSNYDNAQETQNSQFLPGQNSYGTPSNYGDVQYTQNTYLKEKEPSSQQKTPVRFPFKNENLPTGFNGYTNGNPNSNPSNINPSSWIKGQLKGKQMAGQSSYANSYTNDRTVDREFQAPNNHPNKPASTFDLGNREQIEHNKQTHIQNNYDSSNVPIQNPTNYNQHSSNVPIQNPTNYNQHSSNVPIQTPTNYNQHSLINGQNYNSNSSPSYSPLSKSNHPEQQQNSYSSSQDKQINGDSKKNKQFRIVVPEISYPIDNGEQSYSQNINPSRESNSNRAPYSKHLNSYNSAQYPNTNGNVGNIKNPSYTDNGQSPQKLPVYTPLVTSAKCPNGFNGIKPHPTDCSKFLSCANGRTFEMDCGPGTLFNPTLSVCDHPYNVECNRNSVHSTTSPSITEEYTSPTTVEDYYSTTIAAYDDYTPIIESYNAPIDMRQGFDHDTSNSDPVTETELLENHNQAVFETLPTENRQFKILKNPSSIDLPDNFLSNSSITHTPSKGLNDNLDNVAVRIDLKPNSTQSIRLRGGPKNSEGFLQVQEKPFQWGVVCDAPNSWNIEKADIICKQLGFKRGAEQTWQGLTVATDNPARLFRNIGVTKVSCNGQESVLHNCKLQNDKTCIVERDAVWVKCRINSGSECQPEEVSYSDKCYKLFNPVPEKQSKSVQDIGYSKAEALDHCLKRGGKLLDISSQKENDFISEWLSRQKIEGPVMTSGVGVSLLGSPIWLWEGTENPFVYYNWWPGWEFKKSVSPDIKTNRALCVVLQKSFPCPSNPNSTKLCDSEYYYWEAIDCGTKTDHLPYVCERNVDDIGCVNGVGSDYVGSANTTASGNACLSWEDQSVLIAMKYRVSEKTRRSLLTKHNKCRNPDGTDLQPWCYVQTSTGIVRSEFCDISVCNAAKKSSRASSLVEEPKCDAGYFECQSNECITQAWVCDNQADCSNGMDEKNCSNILESFIKTPEARLTNHEVEKWLHTSVHTCANRCKQADGFVCQSFSHNEIDQACILNGKTKYDNSSILESDKSWDYYEIDNALCIGKFICENGNCIDKSKECDGHNDCGDRSDETKCTGSMMGYEIRLAGGNSTNEGRIEVKVLGEWGVICDDKFDMREANVVCQELGFLGSVAVKPNSFYGVPNKTRFVLDDLDCNGNEDSLYSCKFKEWGVHDCNAQESAGVVCRVAGGKACSNEEFECKSGECVPVRFLCDSYADCTDGSDELPEQCSSPLEIRLVGGNERRAGMEGRVEVRQYGVWGTVCDDDFGINEALVICNNLGFKGSAEFKKEAAFGPGKGQIWLDQLRCVGNETSLDHCLHAKWGQHNCKHEEDVSVICHLDRKKTNDSPVTKHVQVPKKKLVKELLPSLCGKRLVSNSKLRSMVQQRIASGFNSERGDHPWQASIRSRTPSGQTEHVCGAVIITKYHVLTAAHCVRDLDKDVYYVRIGDYNMDVDEDSEQDIYIDEIYNHDDFEGSVKLNNDISVVKLKTTGIKFHQYVQPICLPSKAIKLKSNMNCTITGWGSDGSIGSSFAKSLRSASVPIIDMKICKAAYVYGKSAISDGMFCAGNLDGGVDACQGDSGGPLVCSTDLGETVMGITSWGYGCGRANHPGVYTNVQYYEKWMNETLLNSTLEFQK